MRARRLSLATAIPLALMGTLATVPAIADPCSYPLLFGGGAVNTVGSNPTADLAADLDGDGALDLIVAVSSYYATSGSAGQIAVYKGTGTGSFLTPDYYPMPGAPYRMQLVDLDGDGIRDLVTTCFTGNAITVMKGLGSGGHGNGKFGAPASYAAGPHPHSLLVADFDHDGKLDVVVTQNGSYQLGVMRGNGDGSFGPAMTVYPLTSYPTGIAGADLDGDGWMDLVVCVNYSGNVAVLRGQPGGTFAAAVYYPAGAEPIAVAIADWTGDGIADLMVANGSSGGVQLLRGNGSGGVGDGTFGAPQQVLAGNCAFVLPLDADGDGKLDLGSAIATTGVPTSFELTLGDGHGGFASPTYYPVGVVPTVATTGDFDGNGRIDVAVTNFGGSDWNLLQGVCSASPNAPAITAVRDVPNDQGGKLFVTWTRSLLDVTGGPVTSYRVWREIPPAVALARLRREPSAAAVIRAVPAGPAATSILYWEALATLPAQRLAGYGYTAATPQDSMPGSDPYSVFFITAATASPDVFYDSPPDSGYSVDNLAPYPPQGLAATLGAGGALVHWHPNGETDLAGYRLYRGADASFTPSPATLVVALGDTTFTDPNGGPGNVYKLVAVDVHGNASGATSAGLDVPTAALATALAPVLAPDAVTLTWQVGVDAPLGVERSRDGMAWTTLATVTRDGDGFARWTDRDVTSGAAYDYRLSIPTSTGPVAAGEIEVRVPGYALALAGLRPNPLVSGAFAVGFTLGADPRATLEVLDVGGRRVTALDVGGLGAGPHVVDLDRGGRIPAGLYVIRLSSAGRVRVAKAVVMR